jgi:hypothetical protein
MAGSGDRQLWRNQIITIFMAASKNLNQRFEAVTGSSRRLSRLPF